MYVKVYIIKQVYGLGQWGRSPNFNKIYRDILLDAFKPILNGEVVGR